MQVDDVTLTQLAKEGGTARRKKVKNREYIIIRKDGQDRSLGPFNEDLWEKLVNLGLVKATPIEQLRDLQEAVTRMHNHFAALQNDLEKVKARPETIDTSKLVEWKVSNCFHATQYFKNVFCGKFFWDSKPTKFIQRFPNVTFKQSAMAFDGNRRKWRFTPHPEICGLCNPIDNLFSNFNDNTVERLIRLEDEFYRVRRSVNLIKSMAPLRARMNSEGKPDIGSCVYMGDDGYCTKWYYPSFRLGRGQKVDQITEKGKVIGVWRDNVLRDPELCVGCSSFEPRKQQ